MERLAADVNCSLKTIRNDLKQLGSFLEEYGLGRLSLRATKAWPYKGQGLGHGKAGME